METKTDGAGTTTYTYNSENQLIKVELSDNRIAEYKYDPFGRRIEKSVTTVNGTQATRYIYDREDILYELDDSGNVVTEFVHGPGMDEPIAMIRDDETYYYHRDGLGSITAITDTFGNVAQRYEYDSFGNITYQQDPDFVQPYTYTGREYDSESGLYYYRARYYDAKIGRFISRDPIGFAGGINQFAYVLSDPVNFIDIWGLVTVVPSHPTQGCPPGVNCLDPGPPPSPIANPFAKPLEVPLSGPAKFPFLPPVKFRFPPEEPPAPPIEPQPPVLPPTWPPEVPHGSCPGIPK